MLIAVNARLLIKDKLEGIGWFSYETLKRITTRYKNHKFLFIFDRSFSDEFIFSDNIIPVKISPQARHPFLWYLWFEKSLPKILSKFKADMFFSPDGFLSLSADIVSIPVIHDINFAHRPDDLPYWVRNYYNYYFPLYAQKANRIITVSSYSKNDISKMYNIDLKKIDVAYNGVNPLYQPLDEQAKQEVRNKYTAGKPYFIFVGALHPRKNVSRLLQAYDKFREEHSSELKMVIVGDKMFKNQELKDAYDKMKYKTDVIFTGRLQTDDLKMVLASAFALTFVPYFEGFGLPVVEAMACSIPVITSNVTSLPEISGDAAILTDPFSVDLIKDAMVKIYKDDVLRRSLIEKGTAHYQKFSWDSTAERVWNTMTKVMKDA